MQKFAPFALLAAALVGCGHVGVAATSLTPASAAVRDAAPVSLRADVMPMLKSRCTTCHGSWVAADGSPNYAAIKRNADPMILRIQARKMPRDKPGSVTDVELAALKAWKAAGMLDN